MSEQARKGPMTDGEREILFHIEQLQAKWADTVEMCLTHMLAQRERIEALTQEVKELREHMTRPQQGSLFNQSDSL